MASDPLKPNAALLCKLGSLIVHADEALSPNGHHYDQTVFLDGLHDPQVLEWISQMDAMAMLPKKR